MITEVEPGGYTIRATYCDATCSIYQRPAGINETRQVGGSCAAEGNIELAVVPHPHGVKGQRVDAHALALVDCSK